MTRMTRMTHILSPAAAAVLLAFSLASSPVTAAAQGEDQASAGASPGLRQALAKYVAHATYSQPRISPDGRYLAVLSPLAGRQNLVIIDLETRSAKTITRENQFDVMGVRWHGNGFLTFTLGNMNDPGGADFQDGGGLFVVHRSGEDFRELMPTVRAMEARGLYAIPRITIQRAVGMDSDEVIAAINERSRDHFDLYRLNLRTGRKTLLTFDRPGRVRQWLLDEQREIRGAVVLREEQAPVAAAAPASAAGPVDTIEAIGNERPNPGKVWRNILLWRDVAGGPWREAADLGHGADTIVPIAPDGNDALWVSHSRRRDTTALFRLDLKTGQVESEPALAHPMFDIQRDADGGSVPGLQISSITGRPVAVRVEAERPMIQYLDDSLDALHRSLQASFPDQQIELQPTTGNLVMVGVWSDVNPMQVYLYDKATRKLRFEMATRSDIQPGDLQPLRPFVLKTRDGLSIPGYYVLPKTYKPGDKLPTLIHIHGGPMARADTYNNLGSTGVIEAQVLASQGFAVVLPNFRITPGFGKRVFGMGWGSLGRQMSEDHEDALQWAVKAGFADPQRVCIGGSSYGGYATLRALTKTPGMFACGVAGLVVSDLELLLTSTRTDFAGNEAAVAYWRRLIGQKKGSWERAHEVSPARQLAQLQAPLMLWAGREDRRTPLEQYERVVSGLAALGKKPEVTMVKDGEPHGYFKPENHLDLYEQMVLFLKSQIGSQRTRVTVRDLAPEGKTP